MMYVLGYRPKGKLCENIFETMKLRLANHSARQDKKTNDNACLVSRIMRVIENTLMK